MAKFAAPKLYKGMLNNFLAPDVSTVVCLGLIIIAVVAALIVTLLIALSAVLHKVIFSRQDKNPDFKYFTAEDFNLSAENIAVTYRGENLYAKIYSVKPLEECEKVIIFQHGFGAGSSSYMTEIARLAKSGYAVVAADAYGCNNSKGKKIIGFYAGAEAVIATYIGVKCDKRLKNKKLILIGHSWGAYAVLAASNRIKVDGIVAMSGFNAPAQCVCDQLKMISKSGRLLASVLHPFLFLGNIFRFGFKGNTHADKAVKKSGVKAFLIHGEKDRTVPLKHSAANMAEGEGVTKLILPDKKHNPYNTVAAEEELAKLLSNDGKDEEFIKNFDWVKATEEDDEVMSEIDNFIQTL